MQVFSRWNVAAMLAVMALLSAGGAWAGVGQPTDWEIGPQGSATPVMDDIVSFHWILLIIITLITLFVLALLLVVIVRFNARANPTPSRTTHNTYLEIAWTLIPILILVGIATHSFKSLFYQLNTPKADLTVKATGKQWFWTYTYPDQKLEYDSIMLTDKERKERLAKDPNADVPRLLSVDNELVVPVNKTVVVQVTGADVIHAWAVPSFGVKIDAIPGRLNETWFKAEREGIYHGQCSELCGKDHAFMPITVRVLSEPAYNAWLAATKKEHPDWTPAEADVPSRLAAAGQN
jgi:cytochrome c oxidase subunit II